MAQPCLPALARGVRELLRPFKAPDARADAGMCRAAELFEHSLPIEHSAAQRPRGTLPQSESVQSAPQSETIAGTVSNGAARGGAQVPFMFKYAVDALTADPSGAAPLGAAMALTPAALIAGYGVARAGSAMCNELRNATFAKARSSCPAKLRIPATAVPIIPSRLRGHFCHRACWWAADVSGAPCARGCSIRRFALRQYQCPLIHIIDVGKSTVGTSVVRGWVLR